MLRVYHLNDIKKNVDKVNCSFKNIIKLFKLIYNIQICLVHVFECKCFYYIVKWYIF